MGSVLIRGGTVVDGTGRDPYTGDVAVIDGVIVEPSAARHRELPEIDGSGLVVAPGFIDVHTHYDAQVLWEPLLSPTSQYGVTTVIVGNCGFGVAPVRPGGVDYLIQLLARVEGMPPEALRLGISWDWTTFADYLSAIDRPMGANVIPLVGHSALRHFAMGDGAYRRGATSDELTTMATELRGALAAGAWGFSSSVARTHNDMAGSPAPSRLATMQEFELLADVLGEFSFGIIGISPASKLVGLSPDDRSLLMMLSVRGGASVNWNPILHTSGMPELWRTNLEATAAASASGGRVYAVFNPSSSGGTRVDLRTLALFDSLPSWKQMSELPLDERVRAFADPEVRQRLADDIAHDTSMGVLTARLRSMWDILRVSKVHSRANSPYEGRLIGDIARERGGSPLDTMLDIAITDRLETIFMQEDVREEDDAAREAFLAMATSEHVLYGGSDAGAHIDMLANESLPARTLRWRVRDERSLTLPHVVRRFSAHIAEAIGLSDRGRLEAGQAGDVVVFDPDEVGAGNAIVAHDLPDGGGRMMTTALGVAYTIVAGEVVFEHGRHTGALPGRLLRSVDRHS